MYARNGNGNRTPIRRSNTSTGNGESFFARLWMSILSNPWAYVIIFSFLILFVYYFKTSIIGIFNYISMYIKSFNSKMTTEQADLRAKEILDALDGWMSTGIGKDMDKLISNLPKTEISDYYKVSNSFGIKEYGLGGELFFGDSLNMTQWIQQKLSKSDIQQVSKVIPYFSKVIGAS